MADAMEHDAAFNEWFNTLGCGDSKNQLRRLVWAGYQRGRLHAVASAHAWIRIGKSTTIETAHWFCAKCSHAVVVEPIPSTTGCYLPPSSPVADLRRWARHDEDCPMARATMIYALSDLYDGYDWRQRTAADGVAQCDCGLSMLPLPSSPVADSPTKEE